MLYARLEPAYRRDRPVDRSILLTSFIFKPSCSRHMHLAYANAHVAASALIRYAAVGGSYFHYCVCSFCYHPRVPPRSSTPSFPRSRSHGQLCSKNIYSFYKSVPLSTADLGVEQVQVKVGCAGPWRTRQQRQQRRQQSTPPCPHHLLSHAATSNNLSRSVGRCFSKHQTQTSCHPRGAGGAGGVRGPRP